VKGKYLWYNVANVGKYTNRWNKKGRLVIQSLKPEIYIKYIFWQWRNNAELIKYGVWWETRYLLMYLLDTIGYTT